MAKQKKGFLFFGIVIVYILGIVALFFYSFTQIDLSLTLSRVSVWQGIQKSFQYIGYFNRPLSASMYIAIVVCLYAGYLGMLKLAAKRLITWSFLLKLVLIAAFLLGISYNAFSYDLFNYIFDAKIITHYHLNPYDHKALDFPGDPMLSFMHWTHRVYPYGPFWLLLTVPLSFLGLNFFLVTFFLFKFLSIFFYLGTTLLIKKILDKTHPEQSLLGTVFFALNPFVLIESLVSGHNDLSMLFFALLGLYLLLKKQSIQSYLALIFSIGIKFATGILLPLFAYMSYAIFKKKEIKWEKIFLFGALLMIIPVIVASVRTNFQPWYFLYVLPFASLTPGKYYVVIPVTLFSFFALLQYVPFLYLGNWDPPVPLILSYFLFIPIIISTVAVMGVFLSSKVKK